MPRPAPRRSFRPAFGTLAACAALAAGAPRPAGAQRFLIDPFIPEYGPTTTNLQQRLDDLDEGGIVRPFADPFTFYGHTSRSLYIATNGYVLPGGAPSWTRSADRTLGELAADAGPVVAPLYDDFSFDGSAYLLEHVAPGRYQAYTWLNVWSPAGGDQTSFQVAFFTGAARVGGMEFLAGDIAFSYGLLAHTIAERTVTVGVARGESTYTASPGSAEGEVTDLARLPGAVPGVLYYPDLQRFVLLRPNAAGGYDARDVHWPMTVPEPSTVSLFAAGLGALWAARRRRRA